jgi:quercetin dioxygenase-like cupin family protein
MSEPVHDPNRRQRYAFQREGQDLIVDLWVGPGGDVPPHLHPLQEERFTVLEGRFRFTAGSREVLAGPGDEVLVPAGVKHSFRNIGDGEGRMRAEVRPALELQGFLEELAAASRERLYTRRGIPRSPRAAVRLVRLLDRYRDTTVVSFPPPLLQRAVLTATGRRR